jgi:hypothetical protein
VSELVVARGAEAATGAEPGDGPIGEGRAFARGPSAGGAVHEARAVWVVLKREGIRFANDPLRMVVGVLQPVLFLFVLGSGLRALGQGPASPRRTPRTGGHVGRLACPPWA